MTIASTKVKINNDVLVDLPNQKGKVFLQKLTQEGEGKRHLAKALKKPLKRRKK